MNYGLIKKILKQEMMAFQMMSSSVMLSHCEFVFSVNHFPFHTRLGGFILLQYKN